MPRATAYGLSLAAHGAVAVPRLVRRWCCAHHGHHRCQCRVRRQCHSQLNGVGRQLRHLSSSLHQTLASHCKTRKPGNWRLVQQWRLHVACVQARSRPLENRMTISSTVVRRASCRPPPRQAKASTVANRGTMHQCAPFQCRTGDSRGAARVLRPPRLHRRGLAGRPRPLLAGRRRRAVLDVRQRPAQQNLCAEQLNCLFPILSNCQLASDYH